MAQSGSKIMKCELKFVFFEKATKFDEIFILILTNNMFPAQFWIFSKLLKQFEWRPLRPILELFNLEIQQSWILLELSKKTEQIYQHVNKDKLC